ncbi:MAG TPA: HAMP domain-containing sensor histidine kinase [Streptosporangiaceae bacterium]
MIWRRRPAEIPGEASAEISDEAKGALARRLTLRARLALLTAAAVAVAVACCAAASWYLARDQLYGQLDRSLSAPTMPPPDRDEHESRYRYDSDLVEHALANCRSAPAEGDSDGSLRYTTQVVTRGGVACPVPGSAALIVTDDDIAVADGGRPHVYRDGTTTDGTSMRIFTRRDDDRPGVAISTAAPLSETERTLQNLALLLVIVAAVGVVGAATAGLLIARAALRPVDRLTDAAEHIARTEDLDTQIPEGGKDEIARLSRAFNTMTGALSASRNRQRMLIADAGHELRTPLTSLRTNIDLLLRSEILGRDLPTETRHNLLASVKAQLRELSSLVGDLLELARHTPAEPSTEIVPLHEVVANAVERARLRGPGLRIDAETEPWYVHGDAGSLERAVMNLLDNAVKFSPPGGSVEVRLRAGGRHGELTVRDHGPGIAGEDLPYVFERFWRSPSARSLPGAGLGLSIVALVVRESGGEVALEAAPDGGTLAKARFPGSPSEPRHGGRPPIAASPERAALPERPGSPSGSPPYG